jgi:ribonuclease HII
MGRVERVAQQVGFELIIGIDEAGRGPWAGPVVAAAVALPHALPPALASLNDSKQLSEAKREALFPLIYEHALAVGVAQASAQEIDTLNILQATFKAMRGALTQLISALPPAQVAQADLQAQRALLLIDGKQRLPMPAHHSPPLAPHLSSLLSATPQHPLIKGDARARSIAAASVIAKVTRDRLMCAEALAHPEYGFERHKGYGTAQHQAALKAHGPCPCHRLSFKPIKALLS